MVDLYRVGFAHESVGLDGRFDKPVWNQVPSLEFFLPVTCGKPLSLTQAKMLWDSQYLYVVFRAYDKDIWSYLTERDATTCHEDVLEIFLQTHPGREPYFNFEINALGTVYDAYNLKRNAGGGDHHRWSRWNCAGLKTAVTIKGTLNDPSDVDEYWDLEVAVPFAELPTWEGKPPRPGDAWRFHLARYDYSVYLPDGVELQSCTKLSRVDFHRYEEWMNLEFTK